MKLISCYNPKVITNKYTKELVVARCGKCPACLNARSASWVQRLNNESLQHRYTFFVTLQYDEQHVRQLVLLDENDRPSGLPAYIDYRSGQVFDLKDCPDVSDADIHFCENTRFLLVHDFIGFQHFIKLLRKYIYERFPDEKLRYYSAFEYGPTTFRPHIHSLFFFDSPQFAKDFAGLLSKIWKNGYVFDPHPVSGSAASYVASYVNSFAALPKILLHKDLRQKALFSKCPPIGSFTWSEKTFRQFFDKEVSELVLYRKDADKFSYVPFWRFIYDRLYPKIVGFDRLSHTDRVTLYRLGFRFIEDSSAVCYSSKDERRRLSQVNLMYLANWLSRPYWECYRMCLETKNKCEHSRYYNLSKDSLCRFIRCTSRVCQNVLAWNVSLEDYVTKIENFYETLKREEFRDYCQLQDEYFKTHPISDFLAFNPNFCLSVYNKLPSELEDWQKKYLEFYAPNLLEHDVPIRINYKSNSAYQSLLGLHNKIMFDNTKQKKSNDYLIAHKDKFNNILTYNQEINDYVKSKTF